MNTSKLKPKTRNEIKADKPKPDLIITNWNPVFNVLIGKWTEEEKREFFLPDDKFLKFDLKMRYPDLLRQLKLFSTNTQARLNGWDKDIPNGWSELKFKRKDMGTVQVFIWKVTAPINWNGIDLDVEAYHKEENKMRNKQ